MSEDGRRLTDKFALRLPDGLKDRLAEIAQQNKRSTNAEIVARLEWSLMQGDVPVPSFSRTESVEQRVASLEQDLSDLRQAWVNYVVTGNAEDLLQALCAVDK